MVYHSVDTPWSKDNTCRFNLYLWVRCVYGYGVRGCRYGISNETHGVTRATPYPAHPFSPEGEGPLTTSLNATPLPHPKHEVGLALALLTPNVREEIFSSFFFY
jgi:hypothetical protein